VPCHGDTSFAPTSTLQPAQLSYVVQGLASNTGLLFQLAFQCFIQAILLPRRICKW
jgi:hypothetical protein